MFHICRQHVVSSLIRYTGRNFCVYTSPRLNLSITPKLEIRHCLGLHYGYMQNVRYYSKKKDKDDDDDCKPKPIKECEPESEMKKQLPYLNECAKPNLMGDCPKPACPEEDPTPPEPKSNNALLLGLLALLGLAGLVYFMTGQKKEKPPPPPTPHSKLKMKGGNLEGADGKKLFVKKLPTKDPKCGTDLPKEVPYLLIGGGTAAFAAFRAIKSCNPRAKVLVVSNEDHNPYMRPPLSKELWYGDCDANTEAAETLEFKQWNGAVRSLFYEPNEFYTKAKDIGAAGNGGVAVARGYTVTHLDINERKVYLDDGTEISFEQVLIATGSTPKNLDVLEKGDDCVRMRTTTYRTATDFQFLSRLLPHASSIAIIGGGFLGSELACALGRKRKFKVHQIFKEKGNMGSVLPEYLSQWTSEKIKREGVDVIPSTEVIGAAGSDKNVTLKLSNGQSITADLVIVAVGAKPDTSLAKGACLEVDPDFGGYLVNTELQARSGVYVAGDAACFYDPILGRRRIEHHDNAVISGRLAGENMTGACKSYTHQSMFWSDLGPDIGYEAIGLVHSSLPTVGVFAKIHPPKIEVLEPEPIKDIPDQCMPYLSPEEEAKHKALKAEYAEKVKQAEEMKMKAKQELEAKAHEPSPEYNKGVIFYLKDDTIVGIVLWNVFNRMSIARQVLKDRCKYDDLNEVAKLFNIHEEEE